MHRFIVSPSFLLVQSSSLKSPSRLKNRTISPVAQLFIKKRTFPIGSCVMLHTPRMTEANSAGDPIPQHHLRRLRPDCMAGVRGLELRYPGTSYVFEISVITLVGLAETRQ